MKKAIILVVLAGMFFWAVYDSVFQSNEKEAEENVGIKVGDHAPDFELTTLTGEAKTLSDYRGKPVMVNFWASWCGPCRSEMPAMQKVYEEQNINILAVNLTSTEIRKQDVPDFVDEFGLSFPILLDKELNVGTKYQIQPIPTSFFINSEGIISYKHTGPLNEERIMQEFEKMK